MKKVGKLSKLEIHQSFMEKVWNELKMLSINQSVEEILIEWAVKMTLQIIYGKALIDNNDNADELLKGYLFT